MNESISASSWQAGGKLIDFGWKSGLILSTNIISEIDYIKDWEIGPQRYKLRIYMKNKTYIDSKEMNTSDMQNLRMHVCSVFNAVSPTTMIVKSPDSNENSAFEINIQQEITQIKQEQKVLEQSLDELEQDIVEGPKQKKSPSKARNLML